jgi:glycosyltransferase involved in cell wall biosynthesis
VRTLVVTSTFPRWEGDETTSFILHFAQELIRQGTEVEVLAPHAPGAALREELDGVPTTRFRYALPESAEDVCYAGGALFNIKGSPLTAAKLPALVGAQWAAVRSRLASGRFDVVSAHWLLPQGWTAVRAAGRSGVPVVSTVHGSDVFGLNHPVLTRFKRSAVDGSAAVTVNSTATLAAVQRLKAGGREPALIPMGTDVDATADPALVAAWRERHRRGEGPLVAFVGRLIDWKGVDDLLTAVALAAQTLPDLTLVVAGSGPLRAHLETRTRALLLDDRVHFAGWLPRAEVTALQAAADLVAVPSRTAADGSREAQGLSVVEAMALGKPVIASRVGGIPDAITDGQNGVLVAEQDPPALAKAIVGLHGADELRARLGAAAMEQARERYSWEACIQQFSAVFASVAGSGTRRR